MLPFTIISTINALCPAEESEPSIRNQKDNTVACISTFDGETLTISAPFIKNTKLGED